MMLPPSAGGVAFTDAADGDLRNDEDARRSVSSALGISSNWAVLRQVHGNVVRRVETPGDSGEGDALWTTAHDLPLAVFTADCFGVVLTGDGGVGVAHAGWRGADAEVVTKLRHHMEAGGSAPSHAFVGPGIGPCCFEVGDEVAARFGRYRSNTTWGTTSVDLPAVISNSLDGLETWFHGGCTMHENTWFSHRRDQARGRMAALCWL